MTLDSMNLYKCFIVIIIFIIIIIIISFFNPGVKIPGVKNEDKKIYQSGIGQIIISIILL